MGKTIELPDGTPHTFTDEELERGEAMMARLREVEAALVGDTGQTAYSEQLLPCPFCGGRAWVQYWPYPDGMGYEARVVCGECYPPGYEDNLHYEVCSECGTILTANRPGDRHAARASYCPSCGARVED